MKSAVKLALLGLPLALAACSTLEGDKVDYQAATKAPPLAVPPDLSQLPHDTRYATPGTAVTATGYQNSLQGGPAATVAVSGYAGMRIEGSGTLRWLVVKQPADQLWNPIKEFWRDTGLPLVREDAQLGIMETEWVENRAKLPQDFFRRTVGKLIDKLYSTGELDKYRTRLERNAAGETEIYISHRGLLEVYKQNQPMQPAQTAWQERPVEHELEIEMLRRLMVKLGASGEQAASQIAAAVVQTTARLDQFEGKPAVLVSEPIDRAWRRVGLSLDRTGFTVEDRDRSRGLYFVRYVEPTPPGQEEPGFWSRMFGAEVKDKTPKKYRIALQTQGGTTVVSILNADGAAEASDVAQRILKVIADDLH